mmetsp:Transcript_33165/g.88070  ORF Transcript_33165/g.88070 Transcript_33165/m.88070 type:complete len:364 (-) Transcript_33165:27-1118(-)
MQAGIPPLHIAQRGLGLPRHGKGLDYDQSRQRMVGPRRRTTSGDGARAQRARGPRVQLLQGCHRLDLRLQDRDGLRGAQEPGRHVLHELAAAGPVPHPRAAEGCVPDAHGAGDEAAQDGGVEVADAQCAGGAAGGGARRGGRVGGSRAAEGVLPPADLPLVRRHHSADQELRVGLARRVHAARRAGAGPRIVRQPRGEDEGHLGGRHGAAAAARQAQELRELPARRLQVGEGGGVLRPLAQRQGVPGRGGVAAKVRGAREARRRQQVHGGGAWLAGRGERLQLLALPSGPPPAPEAIRVRPHARRQRQDQRPLRVPRRDGPLRVPRGRGAVGRRGPGRSGQPTGRRRRAWRRRERRRVDELGR